MSGEHVNERLWNCPSDFTLERLRQRELAGDAARVTAHHVDDCPSCAGKLKELATPPPALDLESVWQKGQQARWRGVLAAPFKMKLGGMALGVTAAALVALWAATPAATVSKGPPWSLSLIARTSDGSVARIAPGATLRRGDRLRFEVSTTWSSGHVVVLSLDSRGKVSLLAPVSASGDAPTVVGGKRTLLDGAVELDDATGAERVLLVGCRRRLPVGLIADTTRAALERAGGDPHAVTGLGLGCHEESFWISKVTR